jgi:2-iminobutanoate/2-iminopropanoate deaminase
MIERIQVPGAPDAQGPYSPAVRAGDFIFVSGQGPIDAATDKFVFGDIRSETKLVLENVERILKGCGASKADVVRCNVYLAKPEDFGAMNEVYAEFFGDAKPTRTTVGALLVEPSMKVEIDCIAYLPQK